MYTLNEETRTPLRKAGCTPVEKNVATLALLNARSYECGKIRDYRQWEEDA